MVERTYSSNRIPRDLSKRAVESVRDVSPPGVRNGSW